MSRIYTYADGTIYRERPGTRWGRVNWEDGDSLFSGNTVTARAVQDTTPPRGINKGSTIPLDRSWLKYLDNFHTKAASNWMWNPYMLWINRPFIGDSRGSTEGDPEPVLECITGPFNIRRIIGETDTHYEVWAMPTDAKPAQFNPRVFNWQNYPWIFWKAQAMTTARTIQNVGTGLDVFHMNVRKPADRHWMHKTHVELFKEPPFTVTDGVHNWIVLDYMFVGASVYGITDTGLRVPLLLARKPGEKIFATDWRCNEPTVIPPAL